MWTHVGRGGGVKNPIFCGHHKWMTPYVIKVTLPYKTTQKQIQTRINKKCIK